MSRRAGFSIVETLVTLLVLGVIGAAMGQVLLVQSRFIQTQEGRSVARQTARNGSNVVLSELRRVHADSGITAASGTSITFRVPYAIGIICGSSGSRTTIAMMPVDSVSYENGDAALSGVAWRGSDGNYTYSTTGSADTNGLATTCLTALPPITPLPNSLLVRVSPVIAAPSGTPLFLYQRVRYVLRTSVSVPGSIGLWRELPDAPTPVVEELVAPFDASARFRFFTDANPVAQAAVPAQLSDITGIELQLVTLNERSGGTDVVPYTTAVFFKNRIAS